MQQNQRFNVIVFGHLVYKYSNSFVETNSVNIKSLWSWLDFFRFGLSNSNLEEILTISYRTSSPADQIFLISDGNFN
jgi:hypothetical protein